MDCADQQSMVGFSNVFRTLEFGLLALQRLDGSWGFSVAF